MRPLPILDFPPPKPTYSSQITQNVSTPRVRCSHKPIMESNQSLLGNAHEQHMRPISALQLSATGESTTLYSAGMDGLVCQWEISSIDQCATPKLVQSARPHRNWIWDMALCRGQETVVTCSSDCTVKAWNAGTDGSSYELGAHGDFVKALASAHAASWVASGSLDRTICLWDLKEGRQEPMWRAMAPASIYSTACNYTGSVTATGGVDRTIHGWDPRMQDSTFELFGHDDNVRTMCMSPDGRYLLSGSSDTTVRLWSVGEQRCIHTFLHHNSSVWSLYSNDPQLTTFYSGDRDGYLCKVDWNQNKDLSEGQCIVLARESSNETGQIPSILSIAVDNPQEVIWSSTLASSTFRCWKDVPTNSNYQLTSEGDLSNLSELPLKSQVNLKPIRHSDLLYSPLSSNFSQASPALVEAANSSQLQLPESAEEASPLSTSPLIEVPGSHGIIRACMLNDRMHALTIDSGGVVALWHIPKARCLGTFDNDSLHAAAHARQANDDWRPQDKPSDTLDLVQGIIEGDGVTQSWCSLDTSSGMLTVHIDESRVWSAEVYADEFNLDVVSGEDQPWTEDRVVLGVCVLRNLFRGLLLAETVLHPPENNDGIPQLARWLSSLQIPSETLLHMPLSQLPNAIRSDNTDQSLYSIMAHMTGTFTSTASATVPAPAQVAESPLETTLLQLLNKVQAHFFTTPSSATSISSADSNGSLLNGLRRGVQKPQARLDSSNKTALVNFEQDLNALQSILQGPRRSAPPSPGTPGIFYANDLPIELLQDICQSGESKLVYRGSVVSIGRDTPLLELLAPLWLLKILFVRQNPNKELPRIRVHLEKWTPAQVSGTQPMKHALEAPQLSNKYSSVTTPRLLRVARIAEYVYQSLIASGVQAPYTYQSSSSVDVPIDIMCRNVTLPPRLTLVQCLRHWTRGTGDNMQLQYRWKAPAL